MTYVSLSGIFYYKNRPEGVCLNAHFIPSLWKYFSSNIHSINRRGLFEKNRVRKKKQPKYLRWIRSKK